MQMSSPLGPLPFRMRRYTIRCREHFWKTDSRATVTMPLSWWRLLVASWRLYSWMKLIAFTQNALKRRSERQSKKFSSTCYNSAIVPPRRERRRHSFGFCNDGSQINRPVGCWPGFDAFFWLKMVEVIWIRARCCKVDPTTVHTAVCRALHATSRPNLRRKLLEAALRWNNEAELNRRTTTSTWNVLRRSGDIQKNAQFFRL